MNRRRPSLSLSLQFALVMLCFVLIVGTISAFGYAAVRTLTSAQDRVRDVTIGLTAIETTERAMLAREIALVQALIVRTPEGRASFDRANRDADRALQTLLSLPAPNAQALTDVIAVQTASTQWLNRQALPLLARAAEKGVRPGTLLAGYLAQSPLGGSTQIASESISRLKSLVEDMLRQARLDRDQALRRMHNMGAVAALVVVVAALAAFVILHRRISHPLRQLAMAMGRLAQDGRDVPIPFQDRQDEIGAMGRSLLIFRNLAAARAEDLEVRGALTRLSAAVQAQDDLRGFAQAALSALARELGAEVAVFFSYDAARDKLWRFATYGYRAEAGTPNAYAMGEGLIGQVARDRRVRILSGLPDDYVKVHSGTGEGRPQLVLLTPVLLRDRLIGVMEFAALQPFASIYGRILQEAIEIVARPLENLERALETRELLTQSLRQTEELQAAEEELLAQQEELQATNAELACRTNQLEETQKEALARAEELERTSQFKSRFLANMSHELRTPLNSMLILAQDLAANAGKNLQADQIEAAEVIHASGISLLRLINEILDLSKIEAGKIEVHREPMASRQLVQTLEHGFRPLAAQKGVDFTITCAEGLPEILHTDAGRLEQIANNLIGNALKFTRAGQVRVRLAPEDGGRSLSMVVSDTGIGIPAEKLEAIFQPFEQVDGSTHRQFGGTGLGLAISRQLAMLLGGDLAVESTLGQGSVFRLKIPVAAEAGTPAEALRPLPPAPAPAPVPRQGRGRRVLVVEDDEGTQKALLQLMARAAIEARSALTAEEALELCRSRDFDCVILDIGLPGLSGFDLLERLAQTGRAAPVVIYSARDIQPDEILRLRAHTDSIVLKGEHSEKRLLDEVEAFLAPPPAQAAAAAAESAPEPAPATAPATADDGAPLGCKLLLADDDMRNIYALAKVLRARGCEVVLAQDGQKALAELKAHPDIQVVLMDMMMPNMDGYEATQAIRAAGGAWERLPIIALTARAMKDDRDRCLAAGASDYMTKPVDMPQLIAKIRAQLDHAA
ncbi:response regulator [Paracoccus sp. DMF]|uniref:response regulator n=1 Tax=Paracoccus sp. DMF TaxID=400837 RepID=UPI0021E3C1A1|nr:response regulator [Paracoccus sp. DMF]MCV2446211.1 response regulator [Paracoccus sp. DMF]